jgi:ParB family chromosome partitioning protein
MTDITNIPLNKLAQFEGNVRKVQNKGFIDELAASIKAHGLQQNLVVKKDGRKFAVVAGGQRLKALLSLAKAGDISPAHPVPCKIADGDIDASEISLAENAVRDDMHPADAFEAVRDLVDRGVPVADIAARFGRAESYMRQLLKLARVSPVILATYREGKLTLEQVMAFAVSDDHAAQEGVLENLRPHSRDPRTIRDALTESEIEMSDRRVKFVTRKVYEKAGGAVRPDLFSDSVFILDAALLDRLAGEKLERAAKPVATEGWKWVEVHADFGYDEKSRFHRIHAAQAPLPPKLAARVETLERELETLRDQWQAADEDSEEPARIGKIEQRLETIEARRGEDVWTPEQLAIGGAVVTIGNDGKANIERGLVRPEDMPKKKNGKSRVLASDGDERDAKDSGAGMSAALVESLTAHKSAALAARLLETPDTALAAVVHAMVMDVFGHHRDTALKISAAPQSLRRVEGSTAFQQLENARKSWGSKIPGNPGDIWTWCLGQDRQVLFDLLAFCAACSVNAVQMKADRADGDRLEHAGKLAAAVGLDMNAWFTPDAANYFSRVGKAQILADLQEARGAAPAPAWEKMKKAELAALAERETAGKGWLPALLRPAG